MPVQVNWEHYPIYRLITNIIVVADFLNVGIPLVLLSRKKH